MLSSYEPDNQEIYDTVRFLLTGGTIGLCRRPPVLGSYPVIVVPVEHTSEYKSAGNDSETTILIKGGSLDPYGAISIYGRPGSIAALPPWFAVQSYTPSNIGLLPVNVRFAYDQDLPSRSQTIATLVSRVSVENLLKESGSTDISGQTSTAVVRELPDRIQLDNSTILASTSMSGHLRQSQLTRSDVVVFSEPSALATIPGPSVEVGPSYVQYGTIHIKDGLPNNPFTGQKVTIPLAFESKNNGFGIPNYYSGQASVALDVQVNFPRAAIRNFCRSTLQAIYVALDPSKNNDLMSLQSSSETLTHGAVSVDSNVQSFYIHMDSYLPPAEIPRTPRSENRAFVLFGIALELEFGGSLDGNDSPNLTDIIGSYNIRYPQQKDSFNANVGYINYSSDYKGALRIRAGRTAATRPTEDQIAQFRGMDVYPMNTSEREKFYELVANLSRRGVGLSFVGDEFNGFVAAMDRPELLYPLAVRTASDPRSAINDIKELGGMDSETAFAAMPRYGLTQLTPYSAGHPIWGALKRVGRSGLRGLVRGLRTELKPYESERYNASRHPKYLAMDNPGRAPRTVQRMCFSSSAATADTKDTSTPRIRPAPEIKAVDGPEDVSKHSNKHQPSPYASTPAGWHHRVSHETKFSAMDKVAESDNKSVLSTISSSTREGKSVLSQPISTTPVPKPKRPRCKLIKFGTYFDAKGYSASGSGRSSSDILNAALAFGLTDSESDDEPPEEDDNTTPESKGGGGTLLTDVKMDDDDPIAPDIHILLDAFERNDNPNEVSSSTISSFRGIGLTDGGPANWRSLLSQGGMLTKFSRSKNPATACYFPTLVECDEGLCLVPMIIGLTTMPLTNSTYSSHTIDSFPTLDGNKGKAYRPITVMVDNKFESRSSAAKHLTTAAETLGGLDVYSKFNDPIYLSVDPGRARVGERGVNGNSYSLACFAAAAGLPLGPLVTGLLQFDGDDTVVLPIGGLWDKVDGAVGSDREGKIDLNAHYPIIFSEDLKAEKRGALNDMIKQDKKSSLATGRRLLQPVHDLTDVVQWYFTYYERSVKHTTRETRLNAQKFALHREQVSFAAQVSALLLMLDDYRQLSNLDEKVKTVEEKRTQKELKGLIRASQQRLRELAAGVKPAEEAKITPVSSYRGVINADDSITSAMPGIVVGAYDEKTNMLSVSIPQNHPEATTQLDETTSGLRLYRSREGFMKAKAWRTNVLSNIGAKNIRATAQSRAIMKLPKVMQKYKFMNAIARGIGTIIAFVDPQKPTQMISFEWVPSYEGVAREMSKKKKIKTKVRQTNEAAMQMLLSLAQ